MFLARSPGNADRRLARPQCIENEPDSGGRED
jgi:hypothetical protein